MRSHVRPNRPIPGDTRTDANVSAGFVFRLPALRDRPAHQRRTHVRAYGVPAESDLVDVITRVSDARENGSAERKKVIEPPRSGFRGRSRKPAAPRHPFPTAFESFAGRLAGCSVQLLADFRRRGARLAHRPAAVLAADGGERRIASGRQGNVAAVLHRVDA